jgi:hypothetical protein
VTEILINRARMLLGVGMTQTEAATILASSGVCNELAYLAIKAANLAEEEENGV